MPRRTKMTLAAAAPGPRNCMRTKGNMRSCDVCKVTPLFLHTPIRAAGRFCATCCPNCPLPGQTPSLAQEGKP